VDEVLFSKSGRNVEGLSHVGIMVIQDFVHGDTLYFEGGQRETHVNMSVVYCASKLTNLFKHDLVGKRRSRKDGEGVEGEDQSACEIPSRFPKRFISSVDVRRGTARRRSLAVSRRGRGPTACAVLNG